LDKLGRVLDQLEDEGRVKSADYREVDGYYDDLYDRLEALDEALAQADIANEGDRFIIAMVAQWRMQELDHGLSAAMAARLMARLRYLGAEHDQTDPIGRSHGHPAIHRLVGWCPCAPPRSGAQRQ
jgi:hypothetical protein